MEEHGPEPRPILSEEERERAWIARFPTAVHSLAQRVYETRRTAIRFITAKNRALKSYPDDPRTPDLVRRTELVKEEVRQAEAELQAAMKQIGSVREAREQAWVAQFPAELHPLAHRVFDARYKAVRSITAKNRAVMQRPDDPETQELVRLAELAKEEARQAEAEIRAALRSLNFPSQVQSPAEPS